MDAIHYIIKKWPKEKQREVYVVKRFLNNIGINFAFTVANIDICFGEPVDIYVKDIDKKFQIVVGDFELYELAGKTKATNGVKFIDMPERKAEDVIREYINRPLKKKSKYGTAANGIILLIDVPFEPPWIEEILINSKNLPGYKENLKKLGFDEIHLVSDGKNIPVY